MKRPLVVVGIPANNEEKTIAKVILLAQRYIPRILVCDDGSTDLTAEISERLGAEVVRHKRRMGYGAAIRSLFERAKILNSDVLVTIDADGQHDPRDISVLIQPILNGDADIATGSRFVGCHCVEQQMPTHRRIGVRIITLLMNFLSGSSLDDAQHGFRAYSRKALENLVIHEDGMGASVEILLSSRKLALRSVEVPISVNYSDRETHVYDSLRHGSGVLMSLVRLVGEEKPLLIVGLPGLVSVMIGMFFLSWLMDIYVRESRVTTNIALASMAFVLVGTLLLSDALILHLLPRFIRRAANS
jgi:glycosyltransferase involved in cell wall biosynthesis